MHALRYSLCLPLCFSLYTIQHSAAFITLSRGKSSTRRKSRKLQCQKKDNSKKTDITVQNQRSCKKAKRKVRYRCRSVGLKSSAFVFCPSCYLVSQLFWRISICYRVFVEGFMCPPTHFFHTPRPRLFLAFFSLISLSDKFSHPVIVPNQQPLLWVCLVWSGL